MATAGVASSEGLTERSRKFLNAISGPIESVKTPITYRLALLLSAIVMVLLPIVYLAIACAFAYVVYFHATHSIGMFERVRGRGVILVAIVYVAPLVAGVTAVVFMFKPLFSRAPKQDEPSSLERGKEPVLFAFVDRLCDSVHAPRPKQINVDCQVNASASFRRGWLSMLLGNDLTLTIGLPLVSDMNVRQLGGILAHEFGHFAQGGGMRLSYIVRTISHWFTRVVYERDEWDVNLKRWSEENDIRIGIIFYLARGCVWLTRKVLWVLMMIGHGLSGLLLRQMEFDADRHEVRFSGSEIIEPTTRRLHELMVAHGMAYNELSMAMSEGRLADDIVRLMSVQAEDLPDDVDKHIDEQISEGKTGWLDTHPCDRERIASGLKENAPGVFHLEAPARQLFSDFDAVCRVATTRMYKAALGTEFKAASIRPVEEVIAATMSQKNAAKAIDQYILKGWSSLEPIKLSNDAVPAPEEGAAEVIAQIRKLRDRMATEVEAQIQVIEKMDEADSVLTQCAQADLLLEGRLGFKADTFSHDLTSASLVNMASESFNRVLNESGSHYRRFLAVATDRLWATLSLLRDAGAKERLDEADSLREECDRTLLPALRKLMKLRVKVMELRADQQRFMMGLQVLTSGVDSPELYGLADKLKRSIRGQLRELLAAAEDHEYPFQHLEADMSVGRFLVPKMPGIDDFGGCFDAASTALDGFGQLYVRCFGRLCEIALLIEESVLTEEKPAGL